MTVSIHTVLNLDLLSLEDASRILYEQLIPTCEANGIKLSSYGNHASLDTLYCMEIYNQKKQDRTLFNIERIQRSVACLRNISNETFEAIKSCVLKLIIKSHQNEDITNGDCIAAMLLKG